MKINCQDCGALIFADDVDLPSSTAKCRNCNSVFSFVRQLHARPSDQRERLKTPRPDGLKIHEIGGSSQEPGYRDAPQARGSITISRRWFAPHFIFLVFFCIVWDGFLVSWYSNVSTAPGPVSILFMLFPLAHVAAGIGLTYYTLAGFLNRTTIQLDERNLSVRHAPLPWKGNCTLGREEIKQLYCEHEVSRGKNGPTNSYYLSAVLMNESKVRLASMPVDQAKYIEDVLEERLGIHDMAVPGEVG
jgi:hypothetical protein